MIRILIISVTSFTILITLARAQDLYVGTAATDVTPSQEEHVPLGGYGSTERRSWIPRLFWGYPFFTTFRPSEGVLDPIRAKVMYLNRGDKKLLFISLDVVGVTKDMFEDMISRLQSRGFDKSNVIISGTHTHSGPGALAKNPLWQIIAMDKFQKKFYETFVQQVEWTVEYAMLEAKKADLYSLSFDTTGLVHNRRGSDRPLNHQANLMIAKTKDGEWLGGLVNFAIHGTHYDADNLHFSSDVPGAIERSLEETFVHENGYVRTHSKPFFAFVNGAEGDASPDMPIETIGPEFSRQMMENFSSKKKLKPVWKTIHKEITLNNPQVDVSKCVTYSWMPKRINVGVKKFVSNKTYLTQIHFGNLWMLTWPGEPTTELGFILRDQAKAQGAKDAWVLGLSNDHLSYFTTQDEFDKGGYEACSSFFGPTGSMAIIEEHKNLNL